MQLLQFEIKRRACKTLT